MAVRTSAKQTPATTTLISRANTNDEYDGRGDGAVTRTTKSAGERDGDDGDDEGT